MSELLPELLGLTVSEAAGFAIGIALGPALAPVVEAERNAAWTFAPDKALDPTLAARAVAEQRPTNTSPHVEAAAHGYNADRFGDMVQMARSYPGMETLLTLRRRFPDLADNVKAALNRLGLSDAWAEHVLRLLEEPLDPAVIAVSGQRGTLPDGGLLPVGPPTERGKVPPMPQENIDPVEEAAKSGVPKSHLAVMMRNVGLPPGPGELLDLLNRGVIEHADFLRGVAEGNTRNEWAPFLEELRHFLLTPNQAATLRLKGWKSRDEAAALGALRGASPAVMDDLYLSMGRPATVHQIHIGYARGASLPGASGEEEAIKTAVRQSDVRPEYADLLYAQRYSLPSPFVMRGLTQTKVWTEPKAALRLKQAGWIPEDADEAAAAWAGASAGAATADPHVTKAQNQLWTRTHSSYVLGDATEAEASAKLAALGVAADARPTVLALWNQERSLTRKELTAAQLKKAYQKLVVNPATGQPWTRDEVIGELVTRGYTLADAQTYVDTPSGK